MNREIELDEVSETKDQIAQESDEKNLPILTHPKELTREAVENWLQN